MPMPPMPWPPKGTIGPGPPRSGAAAPPQQETTRTRSILMASAIASGAPLTAMACTGRLPTETRCAICTEAPGQRSSMAVICALPLPTTRPNPSSGTAMRTSSTPGGGAGAPSTCWAPGSLARCSAMSSTAVATATGAPLISTRRWSDGPFSAKIRSTPAFSFKPFTVSPLWPMMTPACARETTRLIEHLSISLLSSASCSSPGSCWMASSCL
mmetsp:Transcript_90205/g.250664  ORF Transcript_90205/g.250664 Transcript_90205/m.250664 type:complete len:213 (-) Transcript_90205:61-699(-)